jgi:hypothetical protein
LAEEAALKLPEVELADRARFHFVVRQCALAWSRHPKATFHIHRSRHALALSFEGPVEEKSVALITFRSACEHGDYRFQGFNLAGLPATVSPIARANLQRLKELYEAALPQTFQSEGAVTVLVKRQPAIDFLPIIDEARRVLDEGNQDFPPVDPRELMVVPAEHARMYVGKTTVIPIVRPKVEPPKPAPAKIPAAAASAPLGARTESKPVEAAKPGAKPAPAAAKIESKPVTKAKDVAPSKPAAPAKVAVPAKPAAPKPVAAKPSGKAPEPKSGVKAAKAPAKAAPKPAAKKPAAKPAPKKKSK